MDDDVLGINAAVDALIPRIEDLRNAGITRFRVGGVEVDIGPPPAVAPSVDELRSIAQRMRKAAEPRGPLDSPRSFGMGESRGVPRFRRDKNPDDDEIPEGLK